VSMICTGTDPNVLAGRPSPRWTADRPTSPGWYWHRRFSPPDGRYPAAPARFWPGSSGWYAKDIWWPEPIPEPPDSVGGDNQTRADDVPSLLDGLEEEKRAHATTKAHLAEVEDRSRAFQVLAETLAADLARIRRIAGLYCENHGIVDGCGIMKIEVQKILLRRCNEAMREPTMALREMVAMPAEGEGAVLAVVAERLRRFLVYESENRALLAEVKALRDLAVFDCTCVVCGCDLLSPTRPPHCPDCYPHDEESEDNWNEARAEIVARIDADRRVSR
jgi:hypothetical protein